MSCGTQRCSVNWPPESCTQGLSLMLFTCTLLLWWDCCCCCWVLEGRADPQTGCGFCCGCFRLLIDRAGTQTSCGAQPRLRDGQGSQQDMHTGTNRLDREFQTDTYQCRHQQSSLKSHKWFPSVSQSLGSVPAGTCLFSRCLRLTSGSPSTMVYALFHLMYLYQFSGQVSLYGSPLKFFFIPCCLWFFWTYSPLVFKTRCLGGSSLLCKINRLECLLWTSIC